MANVTEYVRRSTLNMTNLNPAYKRKGRPRLYNIVENDFAGTVTTKWKLDFNEFPNHFFSSVWSVHVQLCTNRKRLHSKKRTTCSGLMKTALNNVLLPTLFKVVNNIVQHCYT